MTVVNKSKPLRQIFAQGNYAWDLLQAEVKLETSEPQMISGEDISRLLQLYMVHFLNTVKRGVQKMNTLIDFRETFFKKRVTSLMGMPLVIKILNKPMIKKSEPAIASCSSPEQPKIQITKKQVINIESPKRNIDAYKQRQLKQKKQSHEMRLAYSAQQSNPDTLKKILAEHSQKQTILEKKIVNIVDSHQQRLRKRISERKMKTITLKSKFQANTEDQVRGNDLFGQNEQKPQNNKFTNVQNNSMNQSKQIVINEFSLNNGLQILNSSKKTRKQIINRSLQKQKLPQIIQENNKFKKRKLSFKQLNCLDQKFIKFLQQKKDFLSNQKLKNSQ